MAFFAIAIAVGGDRGGRRAGAKPLYRAWYLTGAVWTAGWLGLGTAFLLGRTRFGFAFALCLFLAGLFTFLTARRDPESTRRPASCRCSTSSPRACSPLVVAVETYFQNWRWPWVALLAVGGATLLSRS